MKILFLVPGSGGSFYCQNCLRDHATVRALRKLGHDAVMVPLYLPTFDTRIAAPTDVPIFFGGVNTFLRERFPLFKRAPRWLERFFDSRWLLKRAAAREGSTSAAELGAMTFSMLSGLDGNQRKEYARFIEWLASEAKPDIVHISNALLLGFVPAIRDTLGVPIVCSLQDEIPWISAMRPPFDRLCWEAMTGHGAHVAAFVASSRWYAEGMARRMHIPPGRMTVVYPGIDTSAVTSAALSLDPPTIGFLARINEALGFGVVLDAFLHLRKDPAFATLRLLATGGVMPADEAFLASAEARIRAANASGFVRIDRMFQTVPGPEFFDTLSVMSVPVPGGEAFGMPLIEAMARGIPVVQPRIGSYPEMLETGGGVLYAPNDARALADAWRLVIGDPDFARTLGRQGSAVAVERFDMNRSARDMAAVYESIVNGAPL